MTLARQVKSCNLIGPSQTVLAVPRKLTKITAPLFTPIGGESGNKTSCWQGAKRKAWTYTRVYILQTLGSSVQPNNAGSSPEGSHQSCARLVFSFYVYIYNIQFMFKLWLPEI